jgi:hypothetical protein
MSIAAKRGVHTDRSGEWTEFFDLVTSACDAKGKEFRSEFDKSTRPCAYQAIPFKEIVREKVK